MKMKLIIFLLLANMSLHAQQVSFMKYTVQDGLVANPIRCIYQDSKGYIWIGTFDGLSRYDGYKFTNYTSINGLSHSFINSIIEVDGKVLIGENNGSIDVVENNAIVTAERPAPDDRFYPGVQFCHMERFWQVIIGSGFKPCHAVVFASKCRQQNDGEVLKASVVP